MFAYCLNSPIVFTDTHGDIPEQTTTTPFIILVILDDSTGNGGGSSGGGVDSAILTILLLIKMWDIFDRLQENNEKSNSDAIFFAADIVDNQLVKDINPMSFEEAYIWVKTTALQRNVSFNANWGLYTANQDDAMAMAIALGGADPCWDKGHQGQHRHYHVYGRKLFTKYKHFHVWYGEPN